MRILTYCLMLATLCMMSVSCGTKHSTVLRAPGGTGRAEKTSGVKSSSGHVSGKAGTSMTGISYIEQYKGIAIDEMNRYGIPASIKLAQAILESGNGNSYLAKEANNHFGIKCGGVWNGPSVSRADDGPNDCFRVYQDPRESFKDHSQFLLRKRYERLFTLSKDDYKGWARGLKQAGYATNPRYAELLIDLIERYELYQYDRRESYVEREVREEQVEEIIEEKVEEELVLAPEEVKRPVAMDIYEVKPGDTLYSIARLLGLTAQEIMKFNSLDDDTIYIGQLLVVSK